MSNVVEKIHTAPCPCRCGYSCGGPGTCPDWLSGKCLREHFVVDCGHVWDGPVRSGEGWSSGTCARCGTVQMFHDMRCGP